MAFSIQDYLRDNKIELGKHEKAVGDTPYKGGHNDIRKTNYDVKLTKQTEVCNEWCKSQDLMREIITELN